MLYIAKKDKTMYFVLSEHCAEEHSLASAAVLSTMTPAELGARLTEPQNAYLVFDTLVSSLSNKAKLPPAAVATALLKQPAEKRQEAIKKSVVDTSRQMGGDEQFMTFFRQVTSPHRTMRLESIGGIEDDIYTAMNRSAVIATKALYAGQIPSYTEREFVDFIKSTRRTLEKGVEDGLLRFDDWAEGMAKMVEQAALADRTPNEKLRLQQLIEVAGAELDNEARERLMRQYATVNNGEPEQKAKPNGVGYDSPSPD